MRIINIEKLLQISLLSLLLGIVVGCSESKYFENPFLNVSEKEISFSNEAGEKNIMVETNSKDWIATAQKSWVHLTEKGNEVVVQVDPNPTAVERSSYIMVDGGLAVQKIIVKQSAAALSLELSKGEIILPQAGGATMVDLKMAGMPYQVTQEEKPEWLEVIKKKNGLKFISKTNHSVKERTAKLTVTFAGKSNDVVVKQPGTSLFVLACNPGNPYSLYKMMDYEYRRGSILSEYGAPQEIQGLFEESYFFKTPSPLFKDVVYVHDTKYSVPTRIYTRSLTREGIDAVKSQAFQDFMKANGYVRDEKDSNHYINIKEAFTMDVDIKEDNNSVVLFFYQLNKQDHDYPTFSTLDLGPIEFLNKNNKKLTDIENYERGKNSEEMKRETNKTNEVKAILYKTKDPVQIARTYFFYTHDDATSIPQDKIGSLEQFSLFYSQPNLGIWQVGREWFVTREFDKLLTSNNFEFVKYNGKHHVYARRSDHLTLAISGGEYGDVNNGKPVMQITVLYKPTVFEENKEQSMAKIERMLKQLNPSK